MNTKLILLILLTLFLSPIIHAESFSPEKTVIKPSYTGMTVLGFYYTNENYSQTYTQKAFQYKFCIINPQYFKKLGCTEKAFRYLPKNKIWYFPALPEPKIGKTIKWAYAHNEIYRSIFTSFTDFQREVCKNNGEITEKCAATTLISSETKITSRPETYLIPGAKASSITVVQNTYTYTYIKSEKGEYYRLTKTTQPQQTTTEITKKLVIITSPPSEVTQDPTQKDFTDTTTKVYLGATVPTQKNTVEQKDPRHR